jgi:branched-chain amino acid transport system substrate-binding protein
VFKTTRRSAIIGASGAALLGFPSIIKAQTTPTVKVGVLTALTGEYSDAAGSVQSVQMAAEDFNRDKRPDFKIEVLAGDMLDKPDIGIEVARTWFDRDGVDAVIDMPNSAVALGVATLVKDKNKVAMFTGPGTAALTGKACGPNHVHWDYDTWSTAKATAAALLAEGADTWFFITADYAFGHAYESDTTEFVKQGGGKVLGSVAFPFPETSDFSSYLVQAQASGAKVVGLCMSGGNLVNCIKQANEFGLVKGGQRLAGLGVLITLIHSLGLEDGQGLTYVDSFYWDRTEATRAFSRRFAPRFRNFMPNMLHAGSYSAATHYFEAVQALGVEKARDGRGTIAQMKAMPITDPLFSNPSLRRDGRMICDMFLQRVKAPADSHYPWDYSTILRTIPAVEAFRPVGGGCTLYS